MYFALWLFRVEVMVRWLHQLASWGGLVEGELRAVLTDIYSWVFSHSEALILSPLYFSSVWRQVVNIKLYLGKYFIAERISAANIPMIKKYILVASLFYACSTTSGFSFSHWYSFHFTWLKKWGLTLMVLHAITLWLLKLWRRDGSSCQCTL